MSFHWSIYLSCFFNNLRKSTLGNSKKKSLAKPKNKISTRMQETYSDSDDTSTMESQGSDSDSGEGKGEMRGKVTEKDPNYEKKEKCKCNGSCKTRSCSCYEFGSGCNPSCACAGSCKNMFNHLEYFFGETESDANPCFAKWLIKNGNNESALKSTDRNNLRDRILKCDRYRHDNLSKFENFSEKNKKIFPVLQICLTMTNLKNGKKIGKKFRLIKNWLTLKSSFECFYLVALPMNPCISFRFVKMMFLITIMHGIAFAAKVVRSGKSGIAANATNVNASSF